MGSRWHDWSRAWADVLAAVLVATSAALGSPGPASSAGTTLQVWLTTADGASHLTQQPAITLGAVTRGTINVSVNDSLTSQTIAGGFGASITDSSAYLMANLKAQNLTA